MRKGSSYSLFLANSASFISQAAKGGNFFLSQIGESLDWNPRLFFNGIQDFNNPGIKNAQFQDEKPICLSVVRKGNEK